MNSTVYAVDEYGNEAEDVRSGYIGEIKMFGYAGVPEHCLACDGSLLSIAAYPELYAKLGTQHGGDGVTTFALPTAEDVIYAAGDGRAVGAAVVDGLPDATGRFMFADQGKTIAVFANITQQGGHNVFTGDIHEEPMYQIPDSVPVQMQMSNRADTILFALSNANPIYGASSHVQPKGTAFNFCIVYE